MSPHTTEAIPLSLLAAAINKVPVREWSVQVISGPDKGKRYATLEGLVRVGSDPSNDLVLSDATVSRKHLEIERTPRGLMLRDLKSRNGSFVDGRAVIEVMIEAGDKVTLGKTKLAVRQSPKETEVELAGGETFGELVGGSEAMRAAFAELRRVAKEDVTILLEGETGTGKDLAAKALHQHSAKRYGPFRVVDCAMLSEVTADRELFGPDGAFLSAHGGTLFFDEVAEIPIGIQAKLMRVLETKELFGFGSSASKRVDARVIAATSRNLLEEVDRKRFRQELYYRLAIARVRLPALRTRKSDIPLLAKHLMKGLSANFELPPQTLAILEGYDWPGNVRELRNVLERGSLMQQTGNSNWLDLVASQDSASTNKRGSMAVMTNLAYHEAKDRVLADFERHYFAEVLKECNFEIEAAERKTGLSMQSLYRLLKKNGLRLRDLRNGDGPPNEVQRQG